MRKYKNLGKPIDKMTSDATFTSNCTEEMSKKRCHYLSFRKKTLILQPDIRSLEN